MPSFKSTTIPILLMAFASPHVILAQETQFEDVVALAQTAAAAPYIDNSVSLSDGLKYLDYDGYRKIVPRPWKFLWRDQGYSFEVGFHHPGYLFQNIVDIHVIENSQSTRIPFDHQRFDYFFDGPTDNLMQSVPGYAGILALYPFDGGPTRETGSFLGGTYFRIIGSEQIYGSSARLVSVDPLSDNEIFPQYRGFYILKPEPNATQLEIWTWFDSVPLSGAARIILSPGEETSAKIEMHLFSRDAPVDLGLAPLTSMYYCGKFSPCGGDHRVEVHDSDQLLFEQSGEKHIQNFTNPEKETIFQTPFDGMEYFALVQSVATTKANEDAEALYHRRPSLKVDGFDFEKPAKLVMRELHAAHEGVDNIGCFIHPIDLMEPHSELIFSWTVTAMKFTTGAEPVEIQ